MLMECFSCEQMLLVGHLKKKYMDAPCNKEGIMYIQMTRKVSKVWRIKEITSLQQFIID